MARSTAFRGLAPVLGAAALLIALLVVPARAAAAQAAASPPGPEGRPSQSGAAGQGGDRSRIPDEHVSPDAHREMSRPKPLLELGAAFLGTGNIRRGISMPGGAVWQPSFLLFGNFRSGISVADNDETTTTQWANRLDLFGNLYLTGTERLVFGIRPLDRTVDGVRRFTGYTDLSPDPANVSGWNSELNLDGQTITHLFFEGDFQELFPSLDSEDRHALDFGFSVGRQPIRFQEGLLIDDSIDAVGITRNNLKPSGTANLRVTGLWAWNGVNRNTPSSQVAVRNLEAEDSWLAGVFTEVDFRATTMAVDALYVSGGAFGVPAELSVPVAPSAGETFVTATDGVYVGVSFVQRIKGVNTAFRVVGSAPVGERTPADNPGAIGDPAAAGAVLFSEVSWTPKRSENLFYLNGFWAVEQYRAAALDPLLPGPLARTGILFAGVGLGNYPAALSATAADALGAAFGHQMFFGHGRQQLLLEGGGRYSTSGCTAEQAGCPAHAIAAGGRYQIAAGRRGVVVFDGYAAYDALRGLRSGEHLLRLGTRAELLVKF